MEGANIIGAFLEGPCFTEVYKGAQNSKYFIDPTIEMLEEWIVASEGTIKKLPWHQRGKVLLRVYIML